MSRTTTLPGRDLDVRQEDVEATTLTDDAVDELRRAIYPDDERN